MPSTLVAAAVVTAVAIAGSRMPPIGCAESSSGVRHCLSDKTTPLPRDRTYSDPHPATLARAARPFYASGRVVDALDSDALLSGRYGDSRRYK